VPHTRHHSRRGFAAASGAALLAAANGIPAAAPKPAAWVRPPALRPGDTIALVAPAGPADAERVAKGKARFEKLGFKVSVPASLPTRSDRYLAGSDADRAAEFNAAVRDKSVRAVLAVKGGYGLTRILDRIDYPALRADPKIVCGFSDLTGLHLAVARHCRLVTFHSPMVQFGLWRNGEGFDYSNDLFWRTLRMDRLPEGGFTVPLPAGPGRPRTVAPGVARGRLVGGNLTLVATTVGTPYEVEPDGNILLAEDTGEKGYRVDRLFSQLRLAGLLGRFAGVVLGTFDGTDEAELAAIVRDYFGGAKVPVVAGFPVGHTPFNATLAHGARVELDAGAGTVRYLESPVVPAR
jgi:muramoyltetrapeptide carboxypeptidase